MKKHSELFESILLLSDLMIIALCWVLSYHIRFHLLPVNNVVPELDSYLSLLIPIFLIWGFSFKFFGLYRPKRIGTRLSEVFDITKACVASILILTSITFFSRQFELSRLVLGFFMVLMIMGLSLERLFFRLVLSYLRKMGYNLRFALIIGTGEGARGLIERLERHPEIGIKVEGVIALNEGEAEPVAGINILGSISNVRELIRKLKIDNIFIALPWDAHSKMIDVLSAIGDTTVDVKVIPDIYQFMTLRGGAEEFEGMPIINIRDSPLYGWNLIIKRMADIVFSLVMIVLLSPLMAGIAAMIKIVTPGPVFYRQERMGIGGDTFEIIKFRTMKLDAEKETGAVWASENDPRRTGFGALLRETSLDELPQLFNVLKGDMSIVGPRPERPVFIEEFRKNIPRYMLRHKMKAGITGWAQVNGWRGNTDIRKRIEHDLFYIEHWSFAFDLKILILTLWKGFINRNAY